MSGEQDRIEYGRDRLNAVSPSFCMAKWLHASIHLHSGQTHSCHLPMPHTIPVDELKQSPAALHNTEHKKLQRKAMLEGKRPAECSACWAIEDLGHPSDRILYATHSWAHPYIDEIRKLSWNANVMPKYLEVAFSAVCNFKCSYCNPTVSSRWAEEIRQYGPYPNPDLRFDKNNILAKGKTTEDEDRNNPYLKAFWDWWPELYQNLQTFRITGGEPLLTEHTFRIMDWLCTHPNPKLHLAINSNFGVPEPVFNRFMVSAKRLFPANLNYFTVHTSIDTWGEQAEYTRFGLNFEKFQNNIYRYLTEMPEGNLAFMVTFNALSVVQFRRFLEWIYELRKKHQTPDRFIIIDTPHLRFPLHQSLRVLTPEFQSYMQDCIEFVQDNMISPDNPHGFRDVELDKLKRSLAWMQQPQAEESLKQWRSDFYKFFNEHDRRRNTSFLETFPEMGHFWELCKSESSKRRPASGWLTATRKAIRWMKTHQFRVNAP